MQGVLQSRRERLERLAVTEMHVLPVRVSEDRMKQHVIERLAAERHFQGIHDHEVEGDHVARMMPLRKLDVLLDTML